MFARMSTFKGGLERLEEGIGLFRDTVVPEDAKHAGFAGAMLLVDRDTEVAYALTFWESEDAMIETNELGKQLAQTAARELGLHAETGSYEIPFSTFPALVA